MNLVIFAEKPVAALLKLGRE